MHHRFTHRTRSSRSLPPAPSPVGSVDRPLVPAPNNSPSPSVLMWPDGSPSHLGGVLRGSSIFLVLSGPSAASLDLSPLGRRGIVSMAVNNSWSLFRPTYWTGVDPPDRFIDQGWKDPGILKMVPSTYVRHLLRTIDEKTGLHRPSPFRVCDMPSTLLFSRRHTFNHSTFLDDPHVQWGNLKGTTDSLGVANGRSVMLAALRLCFHLGATTVYLVGCDFHMSPDGPAYAFPEDKTAGARRSNNGAYNILSKRLASLVPLLSSRKLRIINCNPSSALRCFPFLSFEEALTRASAPCSKPITTRGWYEPKKATHPLGWATNPHPRPAPDAPLDVRRTHEQSKYECLNQNPRYFAKGHGTNALPHLQSLRPARLIDLGCGSNTFAGALRPLGWHAVGLDWACPLADIRAPMHQTGQEGESFDWITSFDALEHLLPDDVPLVLTEMRRLCAPNARICLSISFVPCAIKVADEPLHMTVQPRAWWLDRLREHGFLIEEPPSPSLSRYIWGRLVAT